MQGYFLQLMLAGFIAALAYSQVTTIRVASNLVLTPVRITDAAGKVVRDLKSEDFDIRENGIKVAVARLGDPGEAPLELAMLFDTSGSVYTRFELERSAAARFLSRIMRPHDSVFIISVANQPRVLLERTSSLDAALQAVSGIAPTTQATAFYNSVAKAVRVFEETERPDARRVIVTISDGEDNRSLDSTQKIFCGICNSRTVSFTPSIPAVTPIAGISSAAALSKAWNLWPDRRAAYRLSRTALTNWRVFWIALRMNCRGSTCSDITLLQPPVPEPTARSPSKCMEDPTSR